MMRDVRTLGGLLEARAAVAPDRPFVTFESGSVTFGEIDRAANRVANALAGLGLRPGDRAAAMLSNRPEYLATWFGMTKAGVIEVPLNTGPPRRPARVHARPLRREAARDRGALGRPPRGGSAPGCPSSSTSSSSATGRSPSTSCSRRPTRPPGIEVSPVRPVRDPLHLGHHRALEGRAADPQREHPRRRQHVRPDGLRRGRDLLQRVPAVPRQRALHDRRACAPPRRRARRPPRPVHRLAASGTSSAPRGSRPSTSWARS